MRDLISSECIDSIHRNLDSLAQLLGASGGQIVHAPPQIVQSAEQLCASSEPAVEHPPREIESFERTYVTRWLSRLVSEFTLTSTDNEAAALQTEQQLPDKCAALLAIAAGRMAAGASIHNHVFHLNDGLLEVQLRDGALVHDSLGTHTWGAAPILSQLLLPLKADPIRDFKLLELGAGTGLVGLALAAWLRRTPGVRRSQIFCTDYHPTVLENLAHNIILNGWSSSESSLQEDREDHKTAVCVTARSLDWQSVHQALNGHTSGQAQELTSQTLPDQHLFPVSGSSWAQKFDTDAYSNAFDTLVAADCVYDPVHPLWICSVAKKLLKKPHASSTDEPLLHVMVPLRPTHQQELQAVYQAFRSQPGLPGPQLNILCEKDYHGYENFGAWNAVARSDSAAHSQPEGGLARTYRWFQIGWR